MTILMMNTIMKIIIDVFVNILFVNKRSKKVTHTHLSLNHRSQLLSWLGALQKPLLLPFYNRGYVERSLGKNICLLKNQFKKKRKLYCSARCILMGLFVIFVKWILFLIFFNLDVLKFVSHKYFENRRLAIICGLIFWK